MMMAGDREEVMEEAPVARSNVLPQTVGTGVEENLEKLLSSLQISQPSLKSPPSNENVNAHMLVVSSKVTITRWPVTYRIIISGCVSIARYTPITGQEKVNYFHF
jgi:hypothetical protein